jgi:hypothetical protein
MQSYEYSIGLRFWHPAIDPDAITQALAMVPDVSWRVGDRRVTPAGTVLGGTHSESYWHLDATGVESAQSGLQHAEDAVIEILESLESHRHFFEGFIGSGGRSLIHLNVHGEGNFAIEFSPRVLVLCGSMGFALATDVYQDKQGRLA